MLDPMTPLPKPAFAIHMNQVHQDTTQLINYIQRQVCQTERGEIHYDPSADHYVLSLDLDQTDRDVCMHLRHQKAKKVWLIVRGSPVGTQIGP